MEQEALKKYPQSSGGILNTSALKEKVNWKETYSLKRNEAQISAWTMTESQLPAPGLTALKQQH